MCTCTGGDTWPDLNARACVCSCMCNVYTMPCMVVHSMNMGGWLAWQDDLDATRIARLPINVVHPCHPSSSWFTSRSFHLSPGQFHVSCHFRSLSLVFCLSSDVSIYTSSTTAVLCATPFFFPFFFFFFFSFLRWFLRCLFNTPCSYHFCGICVMDSLLTFIENIN